MSDLSSVTENFFAVASETFSDNLSSSIAAGASTVPVNNASEFTQGDIAVLTVEPGTNNEATFIGEKDSGNQFINCVWTEGNTAVGHDSGVSIVDYDSATHHSAMTKGLLKILNQDATLKAQPIRDALGLSDASTNGWEVLPNTLQIDSGYNKGNKSYEITIPNEDATDSLSPGMRLRLERGVAAPTQCTDLESSSSQYASLADASVSGISFTDDFTIEVWIKLESEQVQSVISRGDGSHGWQMYITSTGRVIIRGRNSGNERAIEAIPKINTGEWTHIAAHIDMSTVDGEIYINGVNVDVTKNNSGSPSSLVNSGDLYIGSDVSNNHFDGKIADVRVWSAIRTATEIRDNMNQQLTGSETNLVGYWQLNGDFTDETSNGNDLTGSGGAVATDTDNPMNDTEYAIITKVEYSSPNTTVTVFTGTDYNIPNMSLTSPHFSTQYAPFGFDCDNTKWRVRVLETNSTASVSTGTAIRTLNIPAGSWKVKYQITLEIIYNISHNSRASMTLSSDGTSETNPETTDKLASNLTTGGTGNKIYGKQHWEGPIKNENTTDWSIVCIELSDSGDLAANQSPTIIEAVCAYV